MNQPETTSSTGPAVTWFEIGTTDVARASAFYGGLFGWAGGGDPAVYAALRPESGVGGGILARPDGAPPYAVFCVRGADVDAAAARTVALGGSVAVAPTDNPGNVRSAYLRDLDGSLFAVFQDMATPQVTSETTSGSAS